MITEQIFTIKCKANVPEDFIITIVSGTCLGTSPKVCPKASQNALRGHQMLRNSIWSIFSRPVDQDGATQVTQQDNHGNEVKPCMPIWSLPLHIVMLLSLFTFARTDLPSDLWIHSSFI